MAQMAEDGLELEQKVVMVQTVMAQMATVSGEAVADGLEFEQKVVMVQMVTAQMVSVSGEVAADDLELEQRVVLVQMLTSRMATVSEKEVVSVQEHPATDPFPFGQIHPAEGSCRQCISYIF
jgi:cytoskeletal protein CcmA (bactofilin family)